MSNFPRLSAADLLSPGARSLMEIDGSTKMMMNTLAPLGKGFAGWFIVFSMSTPSSLAARDARHHLHPFTNHEEMHAAGTHVMVRGEGVYLWDARGHRMLDGLAGLWCVN